MPSAGERIAERLAAFRESNPRYNQFGQVIDVGDWVGYTSRTGSVTVRKIGTVVGFSERKTWDNTEATVIVDWKWDGTWNGPVRTGDGISRGVSLRAVFKLDPEGVES